MASLPLGRTVIRDRGFWGALPFGVVDYIQDRCEFELCLTFVSFGMVVC